MIAASHWNREGWHSLFGKQSQRWRGKRKALVETLTMRPAETPAQTPSQPNAQIDFPPKPVLLIHLWSEWVSRPIVEFVRALANETEELVAKLKNPAMTSNPDRAWEVDFLRGVTTTLMILLHVIPFVAPLAFLVLPLAVVRLLFYAFITLALLSFGLSIPTAQEANEATAFWKWGRRALNTAALLTAWFFIHGTQSLVLIEMFAGIMGISLLLSYEHKIRRTGQAQSFRQHVAKALPLIVQGTLLALPFSLLGILAGSVAALLAMLGLAQILAYPFLARSRWLSFAVGLAAILLAAVPVVAMLTPNLVHILVLGGSSGTVYSSFLPWFGATLLGIFIGKTLYEQGQRRFELPDISQTTPCRQFIAIGQHAHLVFLLHLPLTLTWVGGTKLYLAPLQASQWPYPFRFV